MTNPSLPSAALALSLLVLLPAAPCRAMGSLDAVLTSLETNGVLADRALALQGGLQGILKAIDPEADLGAMAPTAGDGGVTQAVEAVESWPEDLAYLKVRGLIKNSGGEILSKLQSLTHKAGIILDMRGAGGDDLDTVSALAGIARLHDQEPLYILTDNQGRLIQTNSAVTVLALGVPLMVLIDGETRSASEALVALWRGRPGVMLIGSATRGEARLREQVVLPGGQNARLATRRLIPVAGTSYDHTGVAPDILVSALNGDPHDPAFCMTNRPSRALSAKSERDRDLMRRVDNDAVLRRATDILLGLRTLEGYGQP